MVWSKAADVARSALRDWSGEMPDPYIDIFELRDGLKELPAADRIALARELLPPGFVVAREVAQTQPYTQEDFGAYGWNACRAAMLGDDA